MARGKKQSNETVETPPPTMEHTLNNQINGLNLLTNNFEGEPSQTKFFFKQFEEIALLFKWSPQIQLAILKTKLKGNALRLLITDPDLINATSYEAVKEKLTNYFAEERGLAERQLEFSQCVMKSNENVKAYAHRLVVASNNYLGENEQAVNANTKSVIDKIRLAKFINSIIPELQVEVIKSNPETFEHAVKIATNCQLSMDTVARLRINTLASANHINIEEASTSNKDIQCVLCGSTGHYAVKCDEFNNLIKNYNEISRNNQPRQNLDTENAGNTYQQGRPTRGRFHNRNNYRYNNRRPFYQRQNNTNDRGNFLGRRQDNNQNN